VRSLAALGTTAVMIVAVATASRWNNCAARRDAVKRDAAKRNAVRRDAVSFECSVAIIGHLLLSSAIERSQGPGPRTSN
jgi:hypothetical protein